MAPKKATAAAPAKKASSAPSHASYKGEVAVYLHHIVANFRNSLDGGRKHLLTRFCRYDQRCYPQRELALSRAYMKSTWPLCFLVRPQSCSQPQRGERKSWRVIYHRSLKSAMVAGQSSLALNSCFRVFVYHFVASVHRTFTDSHLPHSRPAIKKYILANNKSTAATAAVFDSQFNKALRTGVEKGDFTQPKGTGCSPKPCFSYNITTRCLHCLISSWRGP